MELLLLPKAPRLGDRLAPYPVAKVGPFIRIEKTKHPNPSPTGNKFGWYWFGEPGGIRTHDLLIRSQFSQGAGSLDLQGFADLKISKNPF